MAHFTCIFIHGYSQQPFEVSIENPIFRGRNRLRIQFSSVQLLNLNFATPWTAAHQASLSITNSWSLFKLMSIELVMPSNHLILCRPLLLLPLIFPSIRVFSSESVLRIRWPMKESFGPRKENNSLKGPLLNHLTSEKTKQNFSSTLMLQAGCIYLGLINPCPETFHPLHLPRRLITPCPTTNVISTKEYSKYPA